MTEISDMPLIDLDAIPVPSFHQILFIGDGGYAIGSYPCATREDVDAMNRRYATGMNNRTCIAAFWYINGEIKTFTFNRA